MARAGRIAAFDLLRAAAIFGVVRLLMVLFHKTGRHKKSRVPRPRNRYFR